MTENPLSGSAGLVTQTFQDACEAELQALKPGNVHQYGAGHGMEVEHFKRAAIAAAPHIGAAGARTGQRIKRATFASVAAAGCNANLGIVLLCAPLAVAFENLAQRDQPDFDQSDVGPAHNSPTASPDAARQLRGALSDVLAELDVEDACDAFEAIAQASPGGLGSADRQDVADAPTVTLRAAMQFAAERDRIARSYVTDFEDIFEFGLPQLYTARGGSNDALLAVTSLHMRFMAKFPDSHIVRKFGAKTAIQVQERAEELRTHYDPCVGVHGFQALTDFDAELKGKGLNPGTTADYVVATLFASALIENWAHKVRR